MRILKNKTALLGGVLVVLAVVGAAAAPLLIGTGNRSVDQSQFALEQRLEGPQPGHPFGLDEDGRDLLTQVVYGARVSLAVSLSSVFFSAGIGILLGLAAGWFGGRCDQAFIFLTDIVMAFPSILLIIALAAFQREGGIVSLVLILSVVGWVSYARIVRGQVLSLKERGFVLAAVGSGASLPRIWVRHLLPNLFAPLVVNATFGMAGIIIAESTLSFLGLGLPPNVPSWGRLLDQGVQYLLIAPHLSIFPGIGIASLVLGFNLLGDGLRDALDVKA